MRERNFEPKKNAAYIVASWRYQKLLVKLCALPTPACLLWLLAWLPRHQGQWPPGWFFSILGGSIGITLLLGFFFWRCPDCSNVIYRPAGSEGFFFLGDPAHCPECGVSLRAGTPPAKKR